MSAEHPKDLTLQDVVDFLSDAGMDVFLLGMDGQQHLPGIPAGDARALRVDPPAGNQVKSPTDYDFYDEVEDDEEEDDDWEEEDDLDYDDAATDEDEDDDYGEVIYPSRHPDF